MGLPVKKPLFEPFSEDGNNSNLVPGTEKTANTHHNACFSGADALPGTNRVKANVHRKRFMTRNLPYKLPIICRCKSGEWYIHFKYEKPDEPGKFKSFKVKDGINRIHDPELKEQAAQELARDIQYWLEVLNYNPFKQSEKNFKTVGDRKAELKAPKNWLLSTAIKQFQDYTKTQGLALRTIRTYNNYLYNLQSYLKAFPEKNNEACKFTEFDLLEFLEHETRTCKWSARTYNNYSQFYHTFFTRCEKLERRQRRSVHYDLNFAELDLKKTKAQRNKAYTPEMIIAIKTELAKKGNEDLRDYIEFIYLSLMRPAEIRQLKIKDIDEENRQMRINGKTGDRLIPISDQLLRLIRKRLTADHNFNYYLFGMAGKVSVSRMSIDYLPEKYRVIKDEFKLDDNYTLYAWKHTGVIRMIKAGFRDEDIMVLTGHKTKAAFEAYKRDLVIENSHVMKGSTIEF